MFSSSPLDKSCVSPDNCSSGRNNASNRFPMGITALGDENQQIRIQLAVHKYNSSANSPLNNRCAVISPVRHSFLKNSLRAKNYEGDAEGTSRSEKKNGNQYEGVGTFPTIHLKKRVVRYRPIRRFKDVKIPYPELPVNRFINHLPEVCSDLKSNTRSVLEVLEDLSGKKIHSKEENGSNKPKLKGLGGDYLLNPNAVYKPLFVQKPKICSVLTRDNTTQTLSPVMSETPSPQSSNSLTKNDASDPRAELRRKLAKQNNEIFASLSSSISSFAVKRKIDKVIPIKDGENIADGLTTKKSKILYNQSETNGYKNGDLKVTTKSKANSTDSVKVMKKSKPIEKSSPTSPSKDRLTTIFLDMQNTTPKAQIFSKTTATETKSMENSTLARTDLSNGSTHIVNGFGSKIVNGSAETNTSEKSIDESGNKSVSENVTVDLRKSENEQPTFNLPSNKVDTSPKDITKSNPTFRFGINTSSTFSFPQTSTENAPILSNTNPEKKQSENEVSNKSFTSEGSKDKPIISSFKLGVERSATLESSSPQDVKLNTVSAPNPMPQFSFGTSTVTTTASQTSSVQFNAATTQNSLTASNQSIFSFGQNPASSKEKNGGETKTSESSDFAIQPSPFSFGQNLDSPKTASLPVTTSTQTISSFSSTVTNSTMNKSLFSFSQTAEAPALSTAPVTSTQEQKFSLSFGQQPHAGKNSEENPAQKTSNLFSFGQKSTSQDSTPAVTSSNQPATTQSTSIFGQNASQPAIAPQPFGKTDFLAKSDSTTTTAGSQSIFTMKTPLFTSPASGFSSVSTPSSTGLATSTSSSIGFGFQAPTTTQSTPKFGVSSAPQTALAFNASGASSTAQTTFGSSVSNSTPAFGVSTTTQSSSTFGLSTTTQAAPEFRPTSITQPISVFSNSQSTPSFGVSSTTQSTPTFGVVSTSQTTSVFASSTTNSTPVFGPSTGFGVSSSTTTSIFGAPTSTQSNIGFGASTAQSNPTFGTTTGFGTTSSTQPNINFGSSAATSTFPSSSTASLGQTNVFGQNSAPGFSSTPAFGSNQNSVFGAKPNTENVFEQNKIQTPAFGGATQPFNTQNKFSFGMSSSNPTGFTTSSPITASAPVFSFGGNNPTNNTFTFGSNTTNNTPAPFSFKSATNEPFKFGATNTPKEGSGFGSPSTSNFNFYGQMNKNTMPEQKPAFNFGGTQTSSSAPFTFGTTPSPSVFSFGGSTSSGSGTGFNFGTPNPVGIFGQTVTASSSAPFAVPGTFSIGSGSSQSRPRATSRPRRRP